MLFQLEQALLLGKSGLDNGMTMIEKTKNLNKSLILELLLAK